MENLKEICTGARSLEDTHVVVFFDRDDDIHRDNLLSTWKGTRLGSPLMAAPEPPGGSLDRGPS